MTGPDLSGVRGLSVRRPWAQLIITGAKPVENRTWTTYYRGPLFIHAGQRWVERGREMATEQGITITEADTTPGWLGVVQLIDIHKAANGCCAPWGKAYRYHWVLADPEPFDAVIPGLGKPFLCPVPPDVLAASR